MDKIQKEFDLILTCSIDNITQDGRFATTLVINYDQFVDNATATLLPKGKIPNEACNIILKYMKSIAEWNEGSANDLDFTSKRQLQSLKNAKQLSAAYLKKIGIPMPTDPMLKQVIAAAENVATTCNATNAKKEIDTLREACNRVDNHAAISMTIVENTQNDFSTVGAVDLEERHFQFIEVAINRYKPKLKAAIKAFEQGEDTAKRKFRTFFMTDEGMFYRTVQRNLIKIDQYHTSAVQRSMFSTLARYAVDNKIKSLDKLREIPDKITVKARADYGKIWYNLLWLDRVINQLQIEEISKTTLHEMLHLILEYDRDKAYYAYPYEALENVEKRDPSTIKNSTWSIFL